MAFNYPEKRVNTRSAYFHLIKYIEDPDNPDKIFKGFTLNISSSGLRLYIYNLLKKGQEIMIISSLTGAEGGRRGTVRWINKVHGNTYEVGLEFA